MKKIFFGIAFLTGISAYAETCNIADQMVIESKGNLYSKSKIMLNFKKRFLRDNNFKSIKLKDLKSGDYAFRIEKSFSDNERTSLALGRCVFGGLIKVATFGETNGGADCFVPDDRLEVTTVQFTKVKQDSDNILRYEVLNQFVVETEWSGPRLPNLDKRLRRKSKKNLLPCSYY